MEDVDDRLQPFRPFDIVRRRFLELFDFSTNSGESAGGRIARRRFLGVFELSIKYVEKVVKRVAGLQLGHQRIREKVHLRLLFILFEGFLKDRV